MESSEKIQSIPIFTQRREPRNTVSNLEFYRYIGKRFFDFIMALIILPIVLPLLGLLAILIKLSSKGPVIYRSKRIGKAGKTFDCLKLRTMYLDADKKLNSLLKKNPQLRSEWDKDQKLKNDPRVTGIGKFIRTFSLDEIPQIFNVLRGDMSFVGPRPIVREEIIKYGGNFENYKSVRPGITGLWQTNGRNDTTYSKRIEFDTEYSNNPTFILDLKIILKTIPVALSQKGAY